MFNEQQMWSSCLTTPQYDKLHGEAILTGWKALVIHYKGALNIFNGYYF